jgi:hypothetical protein
VLFEDSLADGNEFPFFGVLLLRCVRERVVDVPGVDRLLQAIPCRGVDALANRLTDAAFPLGGHVVAVVDGDRAAQHLHCPDTDADIVTSLKKRAIANSLAAKRVEAIVIRTPVGSNTEGVLSVIRQIDDSLVAPANWDRAIRLKKLMDRDTIFEAAGAPPRRDLRKELLARVPALEQLVQLLSDIASGKRPL